MNEPEERAKGEFVPIKRIQTEDDVTSLYVNPIPKTLKERFKAIAALRGQTMNSLLVETMAKIVREYEEG